MADSGASARQAVEQSLAGIGDRVEMLPDRVQVYTTDGEHALQQVHARGIPWRARSSAGRRSKTSFFASREGH
jgi:hypothetical protein